MITKIWTISEIIDIDTGIVALQQAHAKELSGGVSVKLSIFRIPLIKVRQEFEELKRNAYARHGATENDGRMVFSDDQQDEAQKCLLFVQDALNEKTEINLPEWELGDLMQTMESIHLMPQEAMVLALISSNKGE